MTTGVIQWDLTPLLFVVGTVTLFFVIASLVGSPWPLENSNVFHK